MTRRAVGSGQLGEDPRPHEAGKVVAGDQGHRGLHLIEVSFAGVVVGRVGASVPPPAHSGTAVPRCHLGGALQPRVSVAIARNCRPMAAFRVTYATLSADDDELQASYDTAVETARYGTRGVPSAAHRDARDGVRRLVRHPLADRQRRGGRGVRRGRGRRRRRRRHVRRRGVRGMVVDAVAGTGRDPRSGRRPDLRAQRRARRAHGVGERQEPPGGTRRGRRSSRSDPLLHARDGRARRLRRADGAVQRGRGDDAT